MTTDDLISLPELARRSGATERQIRYWTRWNVIEPTRETAGSGYAALYHPNLVPVVATLAAIGEAFHHRIGLSVLARIADHHADGVLEIAPNIVLLWQPAPPLDHVLTDEQVDRLLAECLALPQTVADEILAYMAKHSADALSDDTVTAIRTACSAIFGDDPT